MFKEDISNEDLNELPLSQYKGKIEVITDASLLPQIFEKINQENVVGFDTETKPVFKKGQFNHVSLIQIAIPNLVYLIRINHTGLSQEIIDFIENDKIYKLGVGLRDDFRALHKLAEFQSQGVYELGILAESMGIQAKSLRKLTGIILGFRISKSAQLSNWEAKDLNEKMIRYAATDAWVALEMFHKLRPGKLIL